MSENSNTRPNIRIEIHNNLMETMELDEPNPQENDGEEGEILDESGDVFDCNITFPPRPSSNDQKQLWEGLKAKAINIFEKDDQKKLSERARRFDLDQKTVQNFTEENLQSLYTSLGVSDDNNKQVRYEAIHMHGTEDMTYFDIMNYFIKYTPETIEWINDNSCNIVWIDSISCARALYYLSKAIKGMPVTENDDQDEGMKETHTLLRNNNRQVELDENAMQEDDDIDKLALSDVKVPIPPGYWRLGISHAKSKGILLRFSLKSDRKPLKMQSFTDYYKMYGNPNYGGMKGLISESKKAEFRGIFERNKEIDSKNPWGDLAKTWHKDRKTEEVVEEIPQVNPRMQQRLGFKRSQQVAFESEEKPVVEKPKTTEKSKVPRMRMYADEEEAKIKRKKTLEAMKRKANPPKVVQGDQNDLRNVIRRNINCNESYCDNTFESSHQELDKEMLTDSQDDLGNKLMNRRLKFNINNAPTVILPALTITRKNNVSDVRERINVINKMSKQHRFHEEVVKQKRANSPPPAQPTYRNYTTSSKYNKHDHDNIVHLDDDNYSDEDNYDMQTNSKVTVVIKKPKQPTVASTVWSRVNTASGKTAKSSIKDRLQMPDVGIKRKSLSPRRRTASSTSSDSSSSEDSESVEEDNTADQKMGDESDQEHSIEPSIVHRPGFRSDLLGDHKLDEYKSPLRIEINNDLYQK